MRIESPVLHLCIQDILPRQRPAHLVLLELLWDPKLLPTRNGFAGTYGAGDEALRICFKDPICEMVDPAVGIRWALYEDHDLLSTRLHEKLVPEVDDLLPMISPPTTPVVVTCRSWY